MIAERQISDLLSTEMDRKEFLLYLGAATAGLLGLSTILKIITQPAEKHRQSSGGYGNSVYGK
jgi:hypothetical protein